MKFCKDCDHFRVGENGIEYAKCIRNLTTTVDLVSGETKETGVFYCSSARMPGGQCAPDAKQFRCKACANTDGGYCSEECEDEAHAAGLAEHSWMAGKPLSSVTGVLSEEEKQDLRDAGRGHLA